MSFCVCAGWFTSGAVVGGYGSAAQGGKVAPAALAAAKTWALGVPLGVAIRSIGRGYVPAMSFIGISLAVTGVLMVGWRTALAAVTPEVRCEGRTAGKDTSTDGQPVERASHVSHRVEYFLTLSWAAAYAQAEDLTPAQQAARRKNKKGNPLDGLMMVMSLVKRW